MDALPTSLARTLEAHNGPIYNLTFNKSLTYLMAGSDDAKKITLWNPKSGKFVKSYPDVHGYEVNGIDIQLDSTKFYSVGAEKHGFCVDVATGSVIRKFVGHARKIHCCVLGLDDAVLFTGSADKTIKIWDCRSNNAKNAMQTIDDARDAITSICLGKQNQGELLASSMDGCVRRYDIRAGRVHVDDCKAPVSKVSLSNDENCILASCLNSSIRLIEKDSGELLQTYTGHKNEDFKLWSALDPSDAYVVSGSEDGKIYYWELVEGTIENRMLPDFNEMNTVPRKNEKRQFNTMLSLLFRHDGSGVADMMVCGGSDGKIRIYEGSAGPIMPG